MIADKKSCDRNSKADAVISESTDDEFSIDDEPFTEEELYYYRKMATKWYRDHDITPPANLVCVWRIKHDKSI